MSFRPVKHGIAVFNGSWIIEPDMIVKNRPAKESALKAPNNGMKLDVPVKLVSVLEACTSGMLSSCVRYVIMLAWKPVAANLSHISFAGKQKGQ